LFSHQRKKEKKKSLETVLCMAICGCDLPARCFQPVVAGGIIYADLWGELSTHLALQALFTQRSVCELLLQAFPFPSTLGEVTLHPLSQACMFIYSSCGKWVFPPLLRSFPPTTTFTTFPASDCWACAAAPAGWCVCLQLMWEVGLPPSPVEFSSLLLSQAFLLLVAGRAPPLLPSPARPGLFIYSSGRDSPRPPSVLRAPHCLCYMSLLFLLLLSFSFFPGWGLVCPGGYADLAQGCLWKYRIPLSTPCGPCLPKPSGCGHLVAQGPSWFLRSM
jgi:hypothetical protein